MKKGKPIKKVLKLIDTQLIDELLKQITKDFGKWKCKEIDLMCSKCKAENLRSYLNWYKDMIELNEDEDWEAYEK
jgi:hypothetical protein